MRRSLLLVLLSILSSRGLSAQRIPVIPQGGPVVTLSGHIPPAASQATDRGPIDPNQPIHYVSLIFNKTAEQQANFDRLLTAQRDARSADYRAWLKPAQYADRFGLDAVSFTRVRAWLEQNGFSIDAEAASRTWIAFSGTAAQIDATFHTVLHVYDAGGKTHFAPTRNPSAPELLQPSILAIRGLDDFNPQRVRMRPPSPVFAGGNGGNYLTPDDLEAIYGVAPLYAAGFDGTGQTIAIVGESSVSLDDTANYRTKFNLPAKVPNVIAVADPSIPADTDAQSEAALDLEITGAIARGADQIYVYSTSVEDAATYVIDNSLAPVLSMSFLSCESNFTTSQAASRQALAQEAASKGITWLVAAGDSGPAGCDRQDISGQVAQHGIVVNGFASIPEVTAVGGTEFNEASNTSVYSGAAYWNSANGQTLGSAGGYIPETAWDDSAMGGYLAASGGGSSKLYAKPSWQTGPGVPNDGARDLPDIALSASWSHDGFYTCYAGSCGSVGGGTSAATPMFAGMTILLNQFLLKWGVLKVPGLGNVNPTLYQLAQSTQSPFNDIVTGSNTVPCLIGSPDCATGSFGYSAGPGYDLATGLGSVNAAQLATAWLTASNSLLKPTTTTVQVLPPVSTSPSLTQTITVTVTSAGNAVPGGTVILTAGAVTLGSVTLARGAASSTATFTVYNSQLPLGATTAVAFYTGNSEYLPSSSAYLPSSSNMIGITGPSSAKASVQVFVNPNAVHKAPTAYGNSWNFTLNLREVNGAQASLMGFKVNGVDATAAMQSWLGTTTLAPFGAISIPLQLAPPKKSATVQLMTLGPLNAFGSGADVAMPATPPPTVPVQLFTAPGALTIEVDTPGPTPTSPLTAATFTASLLGSPGAASLQLTGAPSAVLRNPQAPASCQWSQQLQLRELAGTGVTLSKFNAGGTDMSANIASLWGSAVIGPNSALSAQMCYSGVNAPILVNYQISGADDNGNMVSAAMTSPYLAQSAAPTTLTVAPAPLNSAITGALNLNSAGGSLVLNVTTSAVSQVWTASVSTSGISPAWLTVYPLSGTGPGSVYVAPASGQSSGTYTAKILFQSADAQPQVVSIPVTYTVQ